MLLNYGFTVKTKDLKVDDKKAKKIIRSDNSDKFSRVDREGDDYIFRTEYIECPLCSASYNARDIIEPESVTHTLFEVEQFFSEQTDIANYKSNYSLQLNEAILHDKRSIVCPFCGNIIFRNDEKREVILSETENSATVKIEIKNIKELISCLIAVSNEVTIDIENDALHFGRVVLTLGKNGRTYLSYENEFHEEIHKKDITEEFDRTDNSAIFTLISNNAEIKQFIVDYLKPFWESDFPYETDKTELADFIALNRFRGFDRKFYCAVPYKIGTLTVDSSFPVYKTSREALSAFADSSLPQKSKSLKKTLFENQGLLFYISELEALYDCIKNIDIFSDIINCPNINILLYYLHTYPSVVQFIADFCKSGEQKRKFANLINQSVYDTCELAKDYALLRDSYKNELAISNFAEYIGKIERNERDYYRPTSPENTHYSMPMEIVDYSLEDTVFNYDFRYLKSTNDTAFAGAELNNCLTGWRCTDNNVIVIKKGVQLVAAIQLAYRGTRVDQAMLSHNDYIEEDEALYKIFHTWLEKHDLLYLSSGYYEDDDEDEDDDDFDPLFLV